MFLSSKRILFLSAFLLAGCTSTHVGVRKLPLNSSSYASTFAKSPDQKKVEMGNGERLCVDWRIPFSMNPSDYEVVLSIVYKDLSEETVRIPVVRRVGGFNLPLVGDKLQNTKGFLTYKVDLVDKDGVVADTWEQSMWVKVIN